MNPWEEEVYYRSLWGTPSFFNPPQGYLKELKKEKEIPKKYIINRKAAVLIWEDGSKTIIRKSEDDRHDPIKAFLWAFFEKKSGLTRTKANQYLRKIEEEGFRDDKGKKFKRKWNTRGTKRVHRRNNQRNSGRKENNL